MYNKKRLDPTTFEGRMHFEECALRTLSLIIKIKEKSDVLGSFDCYIKTGFEQSVKLSEGDTFVKKSGGLPKKYVDVATLPLHILRQIKYLPMGEYSNGKLLAYVGEYIPHNHKGGNLVQYKGEPLFAKELNYFFKVCC